MLRRSFRVGLFLGVLGGLAFALLKALRSRREPPLLAPPRTPETWPPMRDTAPPAPPPPPPSRPAPAPPPPPPARPPEADEDEGPTTVVAEPVHPPADEPHENEPDPAPPRAKRPVKAARATKSTRKAAKKAARKAARKTGAQRAAGQGAAWVEPSGGVCPPSHPVKAKLSSKIFHLPGQLNYARTEPDRCYRDADTASGDGLRQAKR